MKLEETNMPGISITPKGNIYMSLLGLKINNEQEVDSNVTASEIEKNLAELLTRCNYGVVSNGNGGLMFMHITNRCTIKHPLKEVVNTSAEETKKWWQIWK